MSTDEFDQVAAWTTDAIERLGDDAAVPGACRGSGGPGALAWLSAWLLDGPGGPFLDLGGGLGGPSAWLYRTHAVRSVVAEPMAGAARGARSLFGSTTSIADGARLPFADATFGAGWALGVLSTVPHYRAVLAEAARVLCPGGRFGLVAYLASGRTPIDEPEGSHFPTRRAFDDAVSSAGWRAVETVTLDEFEAAGEAWEASARAVDHDVAAHHRDDPAWQQARRDEERVAALLDAGEVVGVARRLSRN